MENFNIIGKNLNQDSLKKAESVISNEILKSLEKVEGEFEKTEQEKKMILMVDILLEEEFENLGLEYDHQIDEEQVHVLSDHKLDEHIGANADASFDSFYQQIYIDRPKNQSLQADQFHNLLHESIHAVSFNKYVLKENQNVDNYRLGYRTIHPLDEHEDFRAFNEAVTERITLEILNKKEDVLSQELSVAKEDFEKSYLSYVDEVDVLEIIMHTISDNTGKDFEEIWRQMKKSLFTGEMMFLREIEKVFGQNSLKILANMKTHYQKEQVGIFELHKLFFSNKLSDKERNLIGQRILKETQKYE